MLLIFIFQFINNRHSSSCIVEIFYCLFFLWRMTFEVV